MESGRGVHPEVAIKEVAAAIGVLHEADFTMLTDDQLASAVIELVKVTSALEAATTKVVSITDARRAIEDDGAQSMSRWIAWKCHIPHGRAARLARNGRALRHLPEVEDAFAAGDIAGEHVRQLAEACELNEAAFERDTQMLLDHAQTLSYGQFTKSMAHWAFVNATKKAEDAAKKRDATRKVHCSQTFGGRYSLNGILPAVGGTIFANELNRIAKQLFDADVREARDRVGRTPNGSDLRRTAQQRRCDALIEMASRSSARRSGRKPAKPLFTVLLGEDTFRATCELSNGTPVTPGQLAPYITEADIERVLFDGPSRVLDVGVRQRLFTGATRRAVEVRDRTCWHDSCEVPAEECELEHDEPYEVGGLTVQSNGKCGCKFHHRLHHRKTRRKSRRTRRNRPPPG